MIITDPNSKPIPPYLIAIVSLFVALLLVGIFANPLVGLVAIVCFMTPAMLALISWYTFSDTKYKTKAIIIAASVGLALGVGVSVWAMYFQL
jgi:hypothetical protein